MGSKLDKHQITKHLWDVFALEIVTFYQNLSNIY